MRPAHIPLLPVAAVVAAFALAPVASAQTADTAHGRAIPRDLRSPDARDADSAAHARTLQDLARQHSSPETHAGPRYQTDASALAQEKYYSSYGPAPATHHPAPAGDGSPLLAIALGLGMIAMVAGAVAMAVRSRRRVRVAV